MAKFAITYENETIKYELTFRDKVYDFTMYKDDCGMHSDKQLFSYQLENDGVDTSMLDWDMDNVVFTNDEVEILDTLKMLEVIE
jgi:hypothetical protein